MEGDPCHLYQNRVCESRILGLRIHSLALFLNVEPQVPWARDASLKDSLRAQKNTVLCAVSRTPLYNLQVFAA